MRLILLLLLASSTQCLNILVYNPKFGASHVRTMGRITDILVEAGHNVTTLMPIINNNIKTEGTKLSKVIKLPALERTAEWAVKFESTTVQTIWTGNNKNPFVMMDMMMEMQNITMEQCAVNLKTPGLLQMLKDSKFDYVLAEPFDMCAFTFIHLLGLKKYSMVLTTGMMDNFGAQQGLPASASYVPGVMTHFSDKMTFLEKAMNFFSFVVGSWMLNTVYTDQQDALNVRENIYAPLMTEMIARSSFIFVNAEPLVDFPRPTLHKIVSIGGISVKPKSTKKLDEEWDEILSRRPQTVLVSFGSVALSHMMPEEYKNSLRTVFKRFPNVTFIWKYEKPKENVVAGIENVVTNTWTPQQELLADPRMSLFVTHGGMGSTNEAMVNGVPVVAIPVFGDQMRNGKVLERIGIGCVLEKDDLGDANKIADAIGKTLSDPRYMENARRTEKMLREQPFSPAKRLVKSLEFAARFGPLGQLDAHGRHQSFIQFYMLDVVGLIVGVVFTLLSVVYFSIRFVLRKCCFTKTKFD